MKSRSEARRLAVQRPAEHPILFSGALVRQILAGAKGQTRRIVKPQPEIRDGHVYWTSPRYDNGDGVHYLHTNEASAQRLMATACPYGVPGTTRLWVRETFALDVVHALGSRSREHVRYRATDDRPVPRWRPSIFMPRWACRITLPLLSVRVERVQAISDEDIIAEGVTREIIEAMVPAAEDLPSDVSLHELWSIGWSHINGAESWKANPFVWVLGLGTPEVTRG